MLMRTLVLAVLGACSVLISGPLQGQSQQEMNAQSRKDLEMADVQLNALYQKVLKRLPDEKEGALLRKAQRAWIGFRDAEAALYADAMRGGSAAPLLYNGRKTQLTKERIKHLQMLLQQYGDR